MLHFHENLSSKQRFWLGFACCPLTTWLSLGAIFLVTLYSDKIWTHVPSEVPPLVTIFINVSALVFLCGIPVFSGFSTAFFWYYLPLEAKVDNAGLWSAVIACSPTIFVPNLWPFVMFPFLIFIGLYSAGLGGGQHFWKSNRARQWLGDFSDLGPSDAR